MELEPNTCDTTTSAMMCVTLDEILSALPFIFGALFIAGVWALIRHERRRFNGPKQYKGTAPGQGASVLSSLFPGETGGGGTNNAYIHTQNPQKHARAMMPRGSNVRKKK